MAQRWLIEFLLNTEKFFHILFSILLSFGGLQEVLREESRIAYKIPSFAGNGPFVHPGQYKKIILKVFYFLG